MASKKTATVAQGRLPAFEDVDVARAAVRIRRAGDGLSEALKVEPVALHIGDEVHYVLRGVVSSVSHTAKDDVVTRVHIVDAEQITTIDPEVAQKMLQAAAEDVERRKAEITGQGRLDDEVGAGADTNTRAAD